jgi:uncharacterized protein (TIGR02246 family)
MAEDEGSRATPRYKGVDPAIEKEVRTQIRELFREINEAAAKLDQEKFSSYFSPDNVHVFNGVRGEGLDDLRVMHSGWDAITDIKIDRGDPPPDITVLSRDAAVITSTRQWTVATKIGEATTVVAAFTALVLNEENGGWKIVHGHESTVRVPAMVAEALRG